MHLARHLVLLVVTVLRLNGKYYVSDSTTTYEGLSAKEVFTCWKKENHTMVFKFVFKINSKNL